MGGNRQSQRQHGSDLQILLLCRLALVVRDQRQTILAPGSMNKQHTRDTQVAPLNPSPTPELHDNIQKYGQIIGVECRPFAR